MRERSTLPLEGTVIIGIVEIDSEIVLEAEHDAPQRVARTAGLRYAHTTRTQLGGTHLLRIQGVARTAIHDIIVVTGVIGRVASMVGHLVLQDIQGDDPLRIHLHMTDGADEQRSLGLGGSTYDAHVQHGVGTHRPELLRRDVHDDQSRRISRLRHLPTTALHIQRELRALIRARGLQQAVLKTLIDAARRYGRKEIRHPIV